MRNVHELNRKRAEARAYFNTLAMTNTPDDADARLASDMRYQLASDALAKAEREYSDAIQSLTADEMLALAKAS